MAKPQEQPPETGAPQRVTPEPTPKDQSPQAPEARILTRKKPYRMERLLREMQAMEDMMDEMRMKMDRFKRRY
jgi:hypothetical protein